MNGIHSKHRGAGSEAPCSIPGKGADNQAAAAERRCRTRRHKCRARGAGASAGGRAKECDASMKLQYLQVGSSAIRLRWHACCSKASSAVPKPCLNQNRAPCQPHRAPSASSAGCAAPPGRRLEAGAPRSPVRVLGSSANGGRESAAPWLRRQNMGRLASRSVSRIQNIMCQS